MRTEVAFSSLLALALIFGLRQLANCQEPESRVEGNTFVSQENPRMRVDVGKKFTYLGTVPFAIGDAVRGTRYVFVQTDHKKHVQRMFIIQQEGFLPSSNDTYKYSIRNPAKLGDSDYQHSVILDDNNVRVREEPGKEADLTQRFLTDRGYLLGQELVMSRFARPADPQRKHEIIFFCFENLSSFGHKLADFPKDADNPETLRVEHMVDENCQRAFQVDQ